MPIIPTLVLKYSCMTDAVYITIPALNADSYAQASQTTYLELRTTEYCFCYP